MGLWHFTHQKDQEHTRSAGGLFKIDPVEARKHAVMETAVKTVVHSTGEHTEKNLLWALELPQTDKLGRQNSHNLTSRSSLPKKKRPAMRDLFFSTSLF